MNRKLFSLFFKILCLAAFLYQVSHVADLYFKYKTTSSVSSIGKDKQKYPTLMFCVRYLDMIDDVSQTLKKLLYNDVLNELSKLTSRQIFDLTPTTDKIINRCVFRNNLTDIMDYHQDPEICSQMFKTKKVVVGEHVCYLFDPRTKSKYSVSEAATSLTFLNEIYSIYLHNDFLKKTPLVFLVSYFSSSNYSVDAPIYSRIFGEKIVRPKDMLGAQFFIHAMATHVSLQPYPYDTDCDLKNDPYSCYLECFMESLKKIERIPWTVFIGEPNDYKILNLNDMTNKSTQRFVHESQSNCLNLCGSRFSCDYTYTRTKAVMYTNDYGHIRISAMTPFGPDVCIITHPRMILIEFVVHLGSCFGLWFGVSALSLDPSKFLTKARLQDFILKTKARHKLQFLRRQSTSSASSKKSTHNQSTKVAPLSKIDT